MIDYDLKRFNARYPVPADCPAFTLALGIKRGGDLEWWNPDYVPYRGDNKWCVKCPIYGTYCDGNVCKTTIEGKEDY